MKKHICLLLVCALCACALTACSKGSGGQPDSGAQQAASPDNTPVPEGGEGSHGEVDQSQALEDMPTLEPPEPIEGGGDLGEEDYFSIDALINGDDGGAPAGAEDGGSVLAGADEGGQPVLAGADEGGQDAPAAQSPATSVTQVDPSTYQFSALIDTSLGFTFNYPSHWENVPGVYTVCFREKVEPGEFPARIAITAKQLVHSPEGLTMTNELTSYMQMVYRQYDASTFEAGTPNSEDTFMGKPAMSNTYLAYSGDTEVKGFVIGCAVGRRLYVLHFCASYERYAALESVLRYIVKSVTLVEE